MPRRKSAARRRIRVTIRTVVMEEFNLDMSGIEDAQTFIENRPDDADVTIEVLDA